MENYQMFFPCSSTSSSLSAGLSSSSSSSAFPQMFSNFHSGFLGLNNNMENITIIPRSEPKDPTAIGSSSSADDRKVGSLGFVNGGASEKNLDKTQGKKKEDKKVRKPRCAFQTRSQVDVLDDGYRWRKYGQKAVKNNKFPRSYYRCTHQGCNVKKQVQRLTKDEGVVLTTYEGVHSHPIEKATDNFEHILSQMQIYTPF